jgi:O-antigen/teichoic acid export membrane protein
MSMKRAWLSYTAWNVLGMGLPLLVALLVMPMIVSGLGMTRYGLLILAWTVVGYFSIFDFGVSRAITQIVAKVHPESVERSTRIVVVGTLLLGALGITGGLFLFFGAGAIAAQTRVPESLHQETVQCVRILGLGLPMVVMSAGLRGALEGVFDFKGANLIRLATGMGTYVIPALVLPFSTRLSVICAALVLMRVLTLGAYLVRSWSYFRYRLFGEMDAGVARQLLSYGGWITVSNLVSPLMAYMDRFLIAGALTVAVIGYYSTSQEIVARFHIIPGAILSVVFPAISGVFEKSPERAVELFRKGSKYVTFLLLPVAAGSVLFAREGLGLWLGSDFATQAFLVTQVLVIGSFLNCLALSPYSFLQAIGRPDITAKLHLLELPVYLLLLWQLVTHFGLIGVGLAWSARMALDLGLMLFATSRQWEGLRRPTGAVARLYVVTSGLLVPLVYLDSPLIKVSTLFLISVGSARQLWVEWRSGVGETAQAAG